METKVTRSSKQEPEGVNPNLATSVVRGSLPFCRVKETKMQYASWFLLLYRKKNALSIALHFFLYSADVRNLNLCLISSQKLILGYDLYPGVFLLRLISSTSFGLFRGENEPMKCGDGIHIISYLTTKVKINRKSCVG